MNSSKRALSNLSIFWFFLKKGPKSIFKKKHRKFMRDVIAFKKMGGTITDFYPILGDDQLSAGSNIGAYFHQDLLVAQKIYRANPIRHIDIGSRVDGFVSHVAAYRHIEVWDIRPLTNNGEKNISFRQVDITYLNDSYQGIADSVSCLHALEHFGLGRYGDTVDPNGYKKGFDSLGRIVKKGGLLYISFPIGVPAIHFNAHRIFHPSEILNWIGTEYLLEEFSFIDDFGYIHANVTIASTLGVVQGCGIYTLRKI